MITPKLPPDFFNPTESNITVVDRLEYGHLCAVSDEKMQRDLKILEKTNFLEKFEELRKARMNSNKLE